MAYTMQQLEALEEAYASGQLEVEYADKRVKYRSISELERALYTVRRAINKTPQKTIGIYNSGLNKTG